MDYTYHLDLAIKAAKNATDAILDVYNNEDFEVEVKSDNSPLTIADRKSHNVISQVLRESKLPILSEEGKNIPYKERSEWDFFWMIDPIDGTKEFVKRNDEFTVNIALIRRDTPVLGVVMVPVTEDIYWAVSGQGAFKNGQKIEASKINLSKKGVKVVASRSHLNSETEEFVRSLNQPKIVSKGSSLKILMVAEGDADIYPRFAPTMEWDTAAAHVIANEAGAVVMNATSNKELHYNKKDLRNDFFIVQGKY